jgi:glycogen(starch) synthase
MKLLFYSPVFAPSVGGIETVVMSLARGLAQIRDADGRPEFEVIFVSQTPAGEFNDDLLPFKIVRRPSVGQLRRLIGSSDLIHIAAPCLLPLALALLSRQPVIVEHHGFQTICPNGNLLIVPDGVPCPGHFMAGRHLNCLSCHPTNKTLALKAWILTFVRRVLCGHVVANIMPTEWLGKQLGLPNTIIIPHGIAHLTPQNQCKHVSRPPLIVFQGRLVTTKGIDVLLRAAALLRSENRLFELVIIGDGPERDALQDLTRELQLSSYVRFAGRLDAAELESILEKAGIVVVPSLGGEVFGLVVAENMARGLAVVASDLGAFVEVLDGTGFTFPVGNFKDLAHQLEKLLDSAVLTSSLGSRARERVRDVYSLHGMVDGHAVLYKRISAAGRR